MISSQQSSESLPKLPEENFKSPGRKVPDSLRKQQTPIKEEDAEHDDHSDNEKVKVEDVIKERKLEESGYSQNYDDDSFVNEDYLKSSGLVVESGLSQKGNENSAKKFNNPGVSPDRNESVKEDEEIPEEEDEYRDDDFEQESQKSGTQTITAGAQLTQSNMQVGGTLSQSGLPPLGGKLGQPKMSADEGIGRGGRGLLPQDFNLNIADSQISIDFDISDSKVL